MTNQRYINSFKALPMKITILLTIGLGLLFQVQAQSTHSHSLGRQIQFPDIPGYITLKCDFHMHTVFSDGSVWPNIRVQEALKDGLDAIALTEHLEYQPHKQDIPHPDRNRSHQVAMESAKEEDLIIINGSEITRDLPPGHSNAIFLSDANALLKDDPFEVFREAKKQGAFVFWNHPHWTAQVPSGMASLTDMHRQLIKEDLLHGIEVVNNVTYSAEALQIALDNDLAIMGTSDIHGLVDWQYEIPQGGHRPITLVFAKKRSAAGIKEGLENLRTVAWFKNTLIGRQEHLVPLIEATIVVEGARYMGKSSVVRIDLDNRSHVEFTLENRSTYTLQSDAHVLILKPGRNSIEVKTLKRLDSFEMNFGVMNAVVAPKTHPEISLRVKSIK